MTEHVALNPTAAAALVAAAAGAAGTCPADPAGAGAWERTVRARAFDLLRLVPAVVERSAVLAGCRPVTGVIAEAVESKGRGLITIHATMGTPKRNQAVVNGRGVEHIRTAWLSEPAGRALFDQAKSLVGHHCRFGKWVDQVSAELKVSMVEWIEDLGPDPELATGRVTTAAPSAAPAPARMPAPERPRLAAAPALCSDTYRKALLSMAKRVADPSKREALETWMRANGVPPFISPELTAEQATRARAFLAHIDDVAGAA